MASAQSGARLAPDASRSHHSTSAYSASHLALGTSHLALLDVVEGRRQPVLDVPVPRARRAHGAAREREPVPDAGPRRRSMPRGTGAGCCRSLRMPPPTPDSADPASRSDRHDSRSRQPGLHRRVHQRRARKRAPGARADQLRDVGANQPAVPRRAARRASAASGAPARTSSWRRSSKACTVPGHHQRDDDPRRGVAFHRARALSSSARRRRRRCSTCTIATATWTTDQPESSANTSSGWDCCDRAARSRRTAGTTRPICAPTRIAEFLILNARFPRSIRYSPRHIQARCGASRS